MNSREACLSYLNELFNITTMALFGLLWVMRIRAEVRKDKRRQVAPHAKSACLREPAEVLLPPPVSFADPSAAKLTLADDEDESIPPPPPPPRLSAADVHRSGSVRLRASMLRPVSRSAHNLTLECTCPVGRATTARRATCVRFRDDPFGFYSARGQSWNYPSVVSTLPRNRSLRRCDNRPLSTSAQGLV